jgi:NitT/TauT family transport system ATP-binding protein
LAELPEVGVSRIIGLLEVVHDNNDKINVDDLAENLRLDIDDLLPVIKGGEMLGLLKVEKNTVTLTTEGLNFISMKIPDRKEEIRRIMLKLDFFKNFILELNTKKKLSKKDVVKLMKKELSLKEEEKFIKTMIEWGRYAELFNYTDDDGVFKISQE